MGKTIRKRTSTKHVREAYELFTNDELAEAFMQHLEEYKRIERMMNIIKGVAQARMEATGLRILPTSGPIRIKGKLRPDLTMAQLKKGTSEDRGVLIRVVGFQYKEVIAKENAKVEGACLDG